jgi:hypothetical protein
MQNKNKKALKLFIHLFFMVLTCKVLINGALFLIPETSASAQVSLSAEELIYLTNQERIKNHLLPLTQNNLLAKAAHNKAEDLLSKDYFAHTTPEGKLFYQWMQEIGYNYKSAGENLAIFFTKSPDVISAWLNSKTHRDNILDPHYKEIGLAVVEGDFNGENTYVIVQLFGDPAQYNPQYMIAGDFTAKTTGDNHSILLTTLRIFNIISTVSLFTIFSLISLILFKELYPHLAHKQYNNITI